MIKNTRIWDIGQKYSLAQLSIAEWSVMNINRDSDWYGCRETFESLSDACEYIVQQVNDQDVLLQEIQNSVDTPIFLDDDGKWFVGVWGCNEQFDTFIEAFVDVAIQTIQANTNGVSCILVKTGMAYVGDTQNGNF